MLNDAFGFMVYSNASPVRNFRTRESGNAFLCVFCSADFKENVKSLFELSEAVLKTEKQMRKREREKNESLVVAQTKFIALK